MNNKTPLLSLALLALGTGCAYSHHPVLPSALGVDVGDAGLEAVVDEPGPVTVETVSAARWQVPLSGMVNLESAEAKAAGLVDHAEAIFVDVHVIRHPTRGLFLVDSGVTAEPSRVVTGLLASIMDVDGLQVDHPTAAIVGAEAVSGVFLTHMHLDHVMGLPDVDNAVPIYAGPGEPDEGLSLTNGVMAPSIERCLAGKGPLREWPFRDGGGVVDVFGDQTVFALHTPGHSKGSTAYLVRTPTGPVLLTGDTSHTVWGWENGVEAGDYTADHVAHRASLRRLKDLVARHPAIDVRLGHQHLPPRTAPAVARR